MKFSILTTEKILCILHGQFFVMFHTILGKINLAIFDESYIFDHLRESMDIFFYFK